MKKIQSLLILSLTLGLTRTALATCTGGGDPCNAPRNGTITAHTATTISLRVQNAATPNTTNSIYFFEATTLGSAQNSGTPDRNTVIVFTADFTNPALPTDPIAQQAKPLLASTSYTTFSKACPPGSSLPTDAGCSAWVSIGSQATDGLTNAGFSNIAAADTQPLQFTARTNNSVVDQTNVIAWLAASMASTEVSGCSFSSSVQPFPGSGTSSIDITSADCSTLVPNRPYTLTEHLVYDPTQAAPNFVTSTFYTQAATPVAGLVTGVTHCSATLAFTNAAANPANPNDTTYTVSGGGASASKVIGGPGNFSDANSVLLTGLPDGQTINANVVAKNRGGASWRDSSPSNFAPFPTIPFSATGSVPAISITPTTAQYTVTIGNTSGLMSYQVYLNGSPFGGVQSFGSNPFTVNLTGLTPGTNYTVAVKLSEASCTSNFTASASFTTPAGLDGSISFTDHGTNVDMTVTGSGANPPYTYSNWQIISGPSGANLSGTTGATVNMTYITGGAYSVSVLITDSLGAPKTVQNTFNTNQTPTKIGISPSAAQVFTGSNNQVFTATVCDQLETGTCDASSTHKISGAAVGWSVNGGGSVSPANGVSTTFSAGNNPGGPFTLTATLNPATPATASITIVASGFVVTNGPSITVDANPSKTGTASVRATFNTVANDPATIYHWEVASGAGVIQFSPNDSNAARDTVLTFTKADTYTLKVTMTNSGQSFSATTSAGVVPQFLDKILVCPAGMATCDPTKAVTVQALRDQLFTPNGKDQFGDPMTLANITWSVTGCPGCISGTGDFRSSIIGQEFTLTAKDNATGKTGAALVNVQSFDVSNAYGYPVPYKANSGVGVITFANLGTDATIRIFTTSGRKVFETQVTNCADQTRCYPWNVKNSSGESIASGVYFYVIESSLGKKNGKLIIIQ